MDPLRFAIVGTGFWARYQLSGWQELRGAQCAALYNRTRSKAEALAGEFGVPAVYDDADALMGNERLDFVDIITDPGTHGQFVQMAARHGIPVICQKPMAPTLAEAEMMLATCRDAGVPLLIHENWRWQTPIRKVKEILDEGHIGAPFRARIDMVSGFPVFVNQPFLKELQQFILADLGTHILDAARFLFGEASSLCCQTRQVHPDIRGEDVATVIMDMNRGRTTVLCEMAYAENALERECFPETLMFIEGSEGSLELAPDCQIRTTTGDGTVAEHCPPPDYAWADPDYALVHASIVACNANLLAALRGGSVAETDATENIETLRLVFAAYDSARDGKVVHFGKPPGE